MSAGIIERTPLAGGDGDDGPYIANGISEAERMLRERDLQVGVGEFVIEPVMFAVGALGLSRSMRRQQIGINRGGQVLRKRHLVQYTPERAEHIAELN